MLYSEKKIRALRDKKIYILTRVVHQNVKQVTQQPFSYQNIYFS
jgi:hypothetical protein